MFLLIKDYFDEVWIFVKISIHGYTQTVSEIDVYYQFAYYSIFKPGACLVS